MIRFAENLNKMITAGLGGALDPPRTEVAVGHRIRYMDASGPVANFETNIVAPIRRLRVDMQPIQEGSGDPSPDNIRPITGWDGVQVWDDPKYGGLIEWNQLVNGYFARDTGKGLTIAESGNGYSVAGTVTTAFDYKFAGLTDFIRFRRDGRKYLIIVDTATLGDHLWRIGGYSAVALHNGGFMFTQTAAGDWNNTVGVNIELGETVNDTGIIGVYDLTQMFGATKANEIYAMEQAEFGAGVAYFRSLFPADYYPYNAGETTTVSAVNGNPYRQYSITLPTEAGTVYGGTLDVMSGKLTVTHGEIASYNGEVLTGEWMSDRDVYAAGTTPTIGAQVVYVLDTPQTIDLDPQQITTLKGMNNVWSNSGDVTLKYPYYEETEGY